MRIDDVEAVPWLGTELTWRPLRHALGTRIVGMGAYTAERAGQTVIEPHTETVDGRGHEEVYLVLRGRARFTVGGEALDAPAGMFVVVDDPAVHREAVAVEPGTAVLALGANPTFEPAASEWIERARPHIRSDPDRARAIVDELAAASPGPAAIGIAEALLAAGRGDEEAARRRLEGVVSRAPAIRDQLANDPDLGALLRELR